MTYICGPDWDRRVVDIEHKKNSAIIMSGGIDSLVLYNILKDVDIINIVRKDGFDSGPFPAGKSVIGVKEVTTDHRFRIQRTLLHIKEKLNYDYIYTGINLAPPTEYFSEFDTDSRPYRPWKITEDWVKAPFLHLYKYHIIDLARMLNIDISNAQSCLMQINGHCGECWQCKEKKWGYDQLSIDI